MDKKEYTSEKEWLENNLRYKPLSASGYLGKPRRYSIENYIPAYEKLFRDYISDNADNYSLDEFLNFEYNYNNFGFRDDVDYEIDNSKNEIWCFGCSWTAGIGIPREKTWPSLIAKEIGFTVKNFGIGGAGAPTILRLIENWLKFSKYKPKHILILGYFEYRLEIDTNRGDYLRLGFYDSQVSDYKNLEKPDKLKIKQEKNKFIKDPDNYGKPYIDKINNVIENFSSVTLSVHDYNTNDYTIGRDLQFLKSPIDERSYTKNPEKFKKNYYSMADELFSTLLADKHKFRNGFSKSWISHLGPDMQQVIANDFLRNLTI